MPRKNAPAPDPDATDALRALLIDLDLTTLARDLPAVLSDACRDEPGYTPFLLRALEVERAARVDRAIQRRVRWSRLGPYVSLDGFDFAARPQLAPQAVKELLGCRFVEERRNVTLVGRPSLGKTTVARAIGHAACRMRHSAYYIPLAEMLAALRAARADGTYRKAFRRVSQPDLLVLDDCGFAVIDAEQTNELFQLVCARYGQRSTVVVTNLPFRQWGEFLPSPSLAVAIADRRVDNATILRFTGKSWRGPRDIVGAPLDGE